MAEESNQPQLVHPRIPRDLHTDIKAYAKATERSINRAIVYLLRTGLAAEQTRQDA